MKTGLHFRNHSNIFCESCLLTQKSVTNLGSMHIHLYFPRLFKSYLYVNGAHTTMFRPCTISSKKSSPLSRSFSERVGHSVLLLYSHRPFSPINGLGPNLHSVHTMCSVARFLSLSSAFLHRHTYAFTHKPLPCSDPQQIHLSYL